MNINWREHSIIKRDDNSFVIQKETGPYHVPDLSEYRDLYAEIAAFIREHPESAAEEKIDALTPEQEKELQQTSIMVRLEQLDRDGMRPVQELADKNISEKDKKAAVERLASINREKAELRQKLAELFLINNQERE